MSQRIRQTFFECFRAYPDHLVAGEAMSFFLQLFVRYAQEEQINAIKLLFSRTHNTEPNKPHYSARVLNLMYRAIPRHLTDFFLKEKLRGSIDHYVKTIVNPIFKQNKIPTLIDHDTYLGSGAEPSRIIN